MSGIPNHDLKKGGAEDFKNYRPISLVGSLYKLLVKVLANRLKRLMHKLINRAQNAFVEGRQIMDASLMVNEAIDTMIKKEGERGVVQVGHRKIIRSSQLELHYKGSTKTGFGVKWVNWINGSLTGFFDNTRGLRQGDPLSPYLFVIGMEVSSILVDKAASGGFLSGFKLANRDGEELQITHLLYADDTLVFCSDSMDRLAYLNWTLLWFEAIFGLKINLDKSLILSVGDVVNLDVLAFELECRI